MLQPALILLDPLLRPAERTRWLCLLLLVALVTTMLFIGSRPGIEAAIPTPPWDKIAHFVVFGGFATMAWIVMRGGSEAGPIAVAGLISLMDEGMQYYSPGRTAAFADIVADLAGALLAVLVLRFLQASSRQAELSPGSRR